MWRIHDCIVLSTLILVMNKNYQDQFHKNAIILTLIVETMQRPEPGQEGQRWCGLTAERS